MTDQEERDPLVEAARALRAIMDLAQLLQDQAEHRGAHHDMPGGDAMVMLAPVASPEAWLNRIDSVERAWLDSDRYDANPRHAPTTPAEDDPDWAPPLQTLLFWSEAWRQQHDAVLDNVIRPTVESEATWLSQILVWAHQNEPHWDDFANDLHAAQVRLEATLQAGDRAEHGLVGCRLCGGELDRPVLADDDHNTRRRDCRCPPPGPHAQHGPCNCRRTRRTWVEPTPDGHAQVVTLITHLAEPHAHQRDDLCCIACHREAIHSRHDQGGLRDEWVCRRCRQAFGLDEYRQMVARDARDNAAYLPAAKLVERFDVTIGQIRVWANRGHIRRRGRDELGRMLYDVADVTERAEPRAATA